MDDEQQMVVPHVLETRTWDRACAHGRIAHQHTPFLHALDHHEVVIAVLAQQHDGRQVGAVQCIQRLLETIGLEALRHQIAFDVEQRKAFSPDLLLVAIEIHGLEHRLLTHRIAVLVSQQRRHGSRTATEVEALMDRAQETRLPHARDRHVVGRAARTEHVDRTGECRHSGRHNR